MVFLQDLLPALIRASDSSWKVRVKSSDQVCGLSCMPTSCLSASHPAWEGLSHWEEAKVGVLRCRGPKVAVSVTWGGPKAKSRQKACF